MTTSSMQRWWALGALAMTTLAVGVDATVINVALPTLASDLHATTTDLQWFVNSYSLVFAALLLPAGLLGDRFGRKRLLLLGLVVFGAASLACAFASSTGALIAARAVLGLGGAILFPLTLAVLNVLFSADERPKAIAIWAAASAVAFPIGPVLGGWLLTTFWWGSVFLINVPVTVLALILVGLLLPESRSSQRPGIDLVGALTSSTGLTGITYGFIAGGSQGWSDAGVLAAIAIGITALVAFAIWEHRLGQLPAGQPLVDLALFRSASFTWGALLATLVSFTTFGVLFAMPQYFQAVDGADALASGLRLLPVIVGLLVGAAIANRIASRAGAKVTVAAGFALLTAGLTAAATTAPDSGDGFVLGWLSVIGLGLGFALPAATNAALGALPVERSGSGSALFTALRQVGSVIGVAILGTVLSSGYHGRLAVAGLPAQAADAARASVSAGVVVAHQLGSLTLLESVRGAFVYGMDVMLAVCGGIAALGIVLSLALLPRRSVTVAESAADPAESLHEVAAGR